MWKSTWLLLFLLTILAACGEDKKSEEPATDVPIRPTEIRLPITPGIRPFDDLEAVHSNAYLSPDGTHGWIVLEIRNNNPFHVTNYDVTVSLLDENNLEIETFAASTPFLKIPAGYSLPFVVDFLVPQGYTNFMAQVEMDTEYNPSSQALTAEFDLPYAIDPVTSLELPLTVTGTITNDRPNDLITPVIVVALYDESGEIISVAGATSKASFAAGETVPFQATFSTLPTTLLGEIRVVSAGYWFESD